MNTNTASIQTSSSLQNHSGYVFLVILSMVYMSIMLCNSVLTNRYVGSSELFVLGGTLTSPFVFILDDIITEIYGYKIARAVILSGFTAQTIFTLICYIITISPQPDFFKEYNAYYNILGPSLMWINISGCIAYITANIINSYVIARWKFLVKGKYFWLRSIGSSTFSEMLYTFLAIIMMELNSIPLNDILHVASISFAIKVTYSAIFACPASLSVNYIKQKTGIDVYEFPQIFTPFKYKST